MLSGDSNVVTGPTGNSLWPSVTATFVLPQKVLSEKEWLNKMQPEDFRGLTPLFYGHITPYGEFQLDMSKRINIEGII